MTTNIYILLAIFLALSGLDIYTTWLDLCRLPKKMRGQEMNPMFGNVKTNWKKMVIWKVTASLLIALAAWKRVDLFAMLVIDCTLVLVVFNNFYIYAGRKYLHKKLGTMGGFYTKLCRKLHIPKQVAYFMSVFTLGGVAWGMSLLLIR